MFIYAETIVKPILDLKCFDGPAKIVKPDCMPPSSAPLIAMFSIGIFVRTTSLSLKNLDLVRVAVILDVEALIKRDFKSAIDIHFFHRHHYIFLTGLR
ncbi:hypothetical protein CJ20_008 [Escherichia phage CJ20]|nr:hypothetical protein CJ20_008 [Escherichia phage CJ20]